MITMSPQGLFCPAGGFHIDPSKSVDTALITHAHSDHARRGSRRYLCAAPSAPLLQERLGKAAKIEPIPYRQKFQLGRATVSFHSAGHILGSAQVRVEVDGQVWVASGDYKRDDDPTCEPFEVVPCDTFITEATFGLPIYRWNPVSQVAREIHDWWKSVEGTERNCLLYCYSLGKAQRVLAELKPFMKPGQRVLVHDTIEPLSACYREQGIELAESEVVSSQAKGSPIRGALILAPPGIAGTPLMRRMGEFETGFASGWMRVRRARLSRRYDRSFVMSDHADWPSLIRTVRETGARKVYVMHGSNETLARYLTETGIEAYPIDRLPFAESR
jgi:putative mRNA 3-end processing factor